MIELIKAALFIFISFSWVILFYMFWQFCYITWKMGDKVGASIFFLVDVAILMMFAVLLLL